MKKIAILTLAAGMFLAVGSVYGQGTIYLNNYDSGVGLFQGATGTVGAPAGTMVEILAGASASSLTPVVSFNTGSTTYTLVAGDVNGQGAGAGSGFDYGYGHVPSVAPGATAFIQIESWIGGSSFGAAQNTYTFQSAVFSEATGTSPAPPGLPAPATLSIPGTALRLLPVPEPATFALGGLGAAALLLFRRRK